MISPGDITLEETTVAYITELIDFLITKLFGNHLKNIVVSISSSSFDQHIFVHEAITDKAI